MSFEVLEQELNNMNRQELAAFSLGETSAAAKHLEDGPVKVYLMDYLSSVKGAFENFEDSSIEVFDAVMSELRKLSSKLDNDSMEILFCNSIISSCCILLSDKPDHFVEYSIATANNCASIKIKVLQGIIIRDNIKRAVDIKEYFRK